MVGWGVRFLLTRPVDLAQRSSRDADQAPSLIETEALPREEPRSWRRSRHDANPTVQMSVRMPEETYERFRALCLRERRTNGDMMAVLMEGYGTKGRFAKD